MLKHTEGPWRFELSKDSKSFHLVGGRPQFDLTILQPIRWGTHSASLFVRDTAHDGMNLMHKLHEREDWLRPFPGRAHHASWCMGVKHPDLNLIEAAPDLLAALERLEPHLDAIVCYASTTAEHEPNKIAVEARAAIAKARGLAC